MSFPTGSFRRSRGLRLRPLPEREVCFVYVPKRPNLYTLNATAVGHEPAQATVDTRMNGWYFGNILFGGLIGLFIVDPATGAMWRLPKTAHIDLAPASPKP